MSKSGKYKLARQLAGKGAFAEVHLEIDAAPSLSITFQDCDCTERLPTGEPVYSVAVSFGIRFAMGKLAFLHAFPGNFEIRVTRIHTMSVDSTEAFVAYAASKAFFSALGRSDDPMTLDMSTRAVLLSYERIA
jgi:hypothetical protein